MYKPFPKRFSMYAKDDSLTSPEPEGQETVAGPADQHLHELLAACSHQGYDHSGRQLCIEVYVHPRT